MLDQPNIADGVYTLHPWSPVFSARRDILGEYGRYARSTVWDRTLSPELKAYADSLINDPANRAWMEALEELRLKIDYAGGDFLIRQNSNWAVHLGGWGDIGTPVSLSSLFKGAGSEVLLEDLSERIHDFVANVASRELGMMIYTIRGLGTTGFHKDGQLTQVALYAGAGTDIAPCSDTGTLRDEKFGPPDFIDGNLITQLKPGQVGLIRTSDSHRSPQLTETDRSTGTRKLRLMVSVFGG